MADQAGEPKNEPKYLNRFLTWLAFNERVLDEARDTSNPVLERARFLGIAASNLDEFFMIRVSGMRDLVRAGVDHRDPAGTPAPELLHRMVERSRELSDRAASIYANEIVPALRDSGVRFLSPGELMGRERAAIERHFQREIFPILTPSAVDPAFPTPHVTNLVLYLAVRLEARGQTRLAIVQLPRLAPRWIHVGGIEPRFVLLEDVVRENLGVFFEGNVVQEAVAFRVTRDADFATDDQEAEDLVDAVRQVLSSRTHGDPIRLEIESAASDALVESLTHALKLEPHEVCRLPAPLDLRFLVDFSRLPSLPAPRPEPWPPQPQPGIPSGEGLWAELQERDILLFHPYESLEPVLRLLRLAADDPDVLAIKQTLYRTSSTSEVVRSLERAAQSGKQVTVLIELSARFDEERNVTWARRLEDAGAQVLYGLAGLKTHAKALLVVRRGPEGIERYAHIGTGNYNERTALDYSDLSLLTTDEDLCADLTAFFNVVTGYSEPLPWRRIAMAPLGLRQRLLGLIRREIERTPTEGPGQIRAKMNALVDVPLIDALYEASAAGVKIDLNVRGSCLLRPGVKGLSENIRVITLVDRFLEHSRIFEFRNGGDVEVYLGSADWMPRNLDRRVELVVPVVDPAHRDRLGRILDTLLADNVKARELRPDGTLMKRDGRRKLVRAQEVFWRWAHRAALRPPDAEGGAFRPIRKSPDRTDSADVA
ncbi:MAG TPA: polyphosphate kinase 1 [Candidatus Eisenbacteria bacterium]|nr:polyphosphate kinase 1 [Candidatus Eisenbacteria bacterium]